MISAQLDDAPGGIPGPKICLTDLDSVLLKMRRKFYEIGLTLSALWQSGGEGNACETHWGKHFLMQLAH
jgi:hypothetical protein